MKAYISELSYGASLYKGRFELVLPLEIPIEEEEEFNIFIGKLKDAFEEGKPVNIKYEGELI